MPDPEHIVPWDSDEWDGYVAGHPASTLYHTSQWCRIVAEIGGYIPHCWVTRENGRITGLLPALEVRSRLTGNRLVSLPFSDVCYPLANDAATAQSLVRAALNLRNDRRLAFFELRGAPALPGVEDGSHETGLHEESVPERMDFQAKRHFYGYVVPLSTDTESVRMTFRKKSIRQTISKSLKLGVTIRRGDDAHDLKTFYHLYALNRKRHGIPPQPYRLFTTIFATLRDEPEARLYIAEHEGQSIAALVVIRYNGVACAKYEGVDESCRHLLPVNPMFWQSIQDACVAGDHTYDFGRTAGDNRGLNEFKNRWGTRRIELPYFFYPAGEGLSVVKSNSLKYRLFTAAFQRMPLGLSIRVGERIFRHFG